ncbi:DUF6660 family protein [Spongiimicrobium salis]|uniref:DUF6660 family protein n=1 Tax=Spongiimicrobium salis TaxID=1667022 RepID=UPI00374D67E0
MKMLAVILSMLTIFLSSFPCCQESDSCSEVPFVVEHCGNDSSEEESHDEDMPCSPFLSCGSCTGFTINYSSLNFVIPIIKQETKPVPYMEYLPKEVYFLSLKPPRAFEV